MTIFTELSLLLVMTTLVTFVMRFLKQPVIVGYILTGILVGPAVLDIFHSGEQVEVFSKIGISMLLFIVGLGLNPKVIRELGKVSLVTGVGQVLFTSLIGFGIALFLGISAIAALYVAIALTFSSTIIILKLLSDKGDTYKLYGRVSIGFLLVQDLIATIILVAVSALAGGTGSGVTEYIFLTILKGVALAAVLYGITGSIFPWIVRSAAASHELLFLFSLAWGLGLASVFSYLGFSVEIGALVAGVTLSMTPFATEVGARLKPLRDFFIVLFFISLGSHMVLGTIPQIFVPALILSAFVLLGNPVIVIVLMNLLGFKRRTGFMAGLTVAQISEFSLILTTLGFQLGHLSETIVSLVTLVGLITIAGSSYLIIYSNRIYAALERFIQFLEFKKIPHEKTQKQDHFDILLFGYNRVGNDFVEAFRSMNKSFRVVDFNPRAIERLEKEDIPHIYGDAEDIEFLQELPLDSMKMCISTIPDLQANKVLASHVRRINEKAVLIVIAYDSNEAQELYDAGASYVVLPHALGAKHICTLLEKHGFDHDKFDIEKEKHLQTILTKPSHALV